MSQFWDERALFCLLGEWYKKETYFSLQFDGADLAHFLTTLPKVEVEVEWKMWMGIRLQSARERERCNHTWVIHHHQLPHRGLQLRWPSPINCLYVQIWLRLRLSSNVTMIRFTWSTVTLVTKIHLFTSIQNEMWKNIFLRPWNDRHHLVKSGVYKAQFIPVNQDTWSDVTMPQQSFESSPVKAIVSGSFKMSCAKKIVYQNY